MKKTLAIAALAGLATASQGQVTLNLGTLNVGDVPFQLDLNGAGIAPGTYIAANLSTEWLAGPGNPWSNEAIWALTDSTDLNTATFYVDPGVAPNSQGNGDSITLEWNNAAFATSYAGGNPLIFNALQTFGGSSATWGNTTLELLTEINVTPPATNADLGTNPNGMTTTPIGQAEVQWFEFDVVGGAGAQPWSITTAGSTNTGGAFGDNDTELGLYNSNGVLIATNDDEDFGAGVLTSLLDSASVGNLADGTYYIAVGNFNTVFGAANFEVSSDSTASGTNKLTVSFVPAPASAALLGLGGLAAARRRR